MRPVSTWIAAALASAASLAPTAVALAGVADIQVISTDFTHFTGDFFCLPGVISGNPTCISVTIRNGGPDPYQGSASAAKVASLVVSRLKITVDIDEPTKPGSIVTVSDSSFTGTIPPGGSVVISFANHGYVPGITTGTRNYTTTATPGPGNTDPNLANNVAHGQFFVSRVGGGGGLGERLSTTGGAALVAIASALLAAGGWRLRRIRARGARPA